MLNNRDIQRLLTAVGYYNAGIDGDFGPKSWEATRKLLTRHKPEAFEWRNDRQKIAAVQIVLHHAGYEPGDIDGYYGPNTREAFNTWDYFQSHGKAEILPGRTVEEINTAEDELEFKWPSQKNVEKVFGKGGGPKATAGKVILPITMRIAWNLDQQIRQFNCHEKVAEPLTSIFNQAVSHYGESMFRELRLDLFGGCYNHRKMRGGTALSMHSYGIAVDLDPEWNQLRWGKDRAAFAQPSYDPFWRIVEAHGAISLGRERDYDWMHFQFATL